MNLKCSPQEKLERRSSLNLLELSDTRGSGLVEVLIAGLILCGIGLFMGTLTNNLNRATRNVSQNLDTSEASYVIQMALNNASSCSASLQADLVGQTIPTVTNVPLTFSATTSGGGIGTKLIAQGDQLGQVRVTLLQLTQTPVLTSIPNQYLTTLTMTTTKLAAGGSDTTMGSQTFTRTFPVLLTADPITNKVTGCVSANADQFCADSGGTWVAGTPGKCIFPQLFVSPAGVVPPPAVTASPFNVHTLKGGNMGFGAWGGEVYYDGGGDSTVNIANTGFSPTGATLLTWNYDATKTPMPGNVVAPSTVNILALINDGRVGINYTPPAYGLLPTLIPNIAGTKLYVNGDANVNGIMTATSFVPPSDRRLKTDIEPLEDSLEKVLALQGVRFHWKPENRPHGAHGGDEEIGLIAQDVEKVVPQLVVTDSRGMKGVKYENSVALLVESIKTLSVKIEEQSVQLKEQNAQILEMQAELGSGKMSSNR